jgi:hypothetical protein
MNDLWVCGLEFGIERENRLDCQIIQENASFGKNGGSHLNRHCISQVKTIARTDFSYYPNNLFYLASIGGHDPKE